MALDLYTDAYLDPYGVASSTGVSLAVSANAGGAASPGILLRVLALDNAQLPASLNTVSQSGTAAHDATFTPVYSGSRVLAAVFNNAAGPPAAASGNTVIDSVSDTISGAYGYGTYESNASSGTATPIDDELVLPILDEYGSDIDDESGTPSSFLVGSTAANGGGLAALEIQPNGTISTDASSPAAVSSVTLGAGVTVVTTAAFRPPTGALLVALVTAAGSAYGQVTMSVTDSYGFTWVEAARANATGQGYAGIWYATAPTALSSAAATLPGGNVGFTYTAQLAAAGGYPPYTYALASGSLPAGLSLANSGAITGTPTTAATSTFTVTVTDSFGNTATSGTQSITVSGAAPANPFALTTWSAQAAMYEYGTTSVGVATQDHDWILVVASWTDSQDSKAIGFVSDNAHNVYRPLGLSNTGFANIQAWMCPNAKAVTEVFFSESAFVRNLAITVLDIRGMQAGYVVDVSAAPVNGSTSSGWTMNVTTTQPDFLIAAGVSQAPNTTLPAAWNPSTFNTFASTSGLFPPATTGQVTGWQYKGTPGAVSAAFTASGSGSVQYAGLLFAFRSQAAPTLSAPGNPAFPFVKVQAAFGYQPGNPTGLPTWTDISSRFLGVTGQRGRNFELDELTAADMTLELDNRDGALSPQNQSSPYWPNVTLITPVQMTADWQGRRHSVFYGLMTAIPQTYDFQRGIVKVSLSDDYSKLPQILLPSAMIADLLYDQPLHLWPLNDSQQAIQASNWSGRSTSVLVPVKGKYGGGVTGNTPNTGFGNQISGNYPAGLEGTTDTGFGNFTGSINVSVPIVGHPGSFNTFQAYVKGTCLVNRDDPTLPMTSTGATYEFWANIANDANNAESGALLMVLADEKGTSAAGSFLRLSATNVGTVAAPQTQMFAVQEGVSWSNVQQISNIPNLFDSRWHHYAVTFTTAGAVNIYIDGNLAGFFNGRYPAGTPNRLSLGGDAAVNPYLGSNIYSGSLFSGGGFFTGLIANCAVYDRVIDVERIRSHVQSGQTGFVGEASGIRIQRVLQWARWAGPQAIEYGTSHMQVFNYLGGGYGASGLSGAIGQFGTAGGGFNDMGAQADVTIQDVANSECGFLFVSADGTLTFRERDTAFNQAVTGSLGDMDYALNQTGTFANGLGPWTATANCALGTTGTWSYDGGSAAVMTVTGTPAHADARSETLTAQQAGASMWVMSPQGCFAQAWIDWYGVSGYISSSPGTGAWCPPMTPVKLNAPVASPPGGALTMRFGPDIINSPATGTQLYFDHARISPGAFQVPYMGDVEIIEDSQYLFNDVAVTRNIDQALYRAKDDTSRKQYYPRVYLRTIYTAENDPQAVVDVANWLLSAYSQPQLRVSKVTVDAASNPEAWEFVLRTDIGDIVSFQRTPVGGAPVQGAFLVLSVQVDWEAGDDNTNPKAEFTYVLAPSPGAGILTLDDPVYGLIGGSNGLGW